jgi:hypothetical protein
MVLRRKAFCRISHEKAMEKAENEYRKFQEKILSGVENFVLK